MGEQGMKAVIDNSEFLPNKFNAHNPATAAHGKWPSLGARAEHIASAISRTSQGSARWVEVYNRALAHLKEIAAL